MMLRRRLYSRSCWSLEFFNGFLYWFLLRNFLEDWQWFFELWLFDLLWFGGLCLCHKLLHRLDWLQFGRFDLGMNHLHALLRRDPWHDLRHWLDLTNKLSWCLLGGLDLRGRRDSILLQHFWRRVNQGHFPSERFLLEHDRHFWHDHHNCQNQPKMEQERYTPPLHYLFCMYGFRSDHVHHLTMPHTITIHLIDADFISSCF